MTDPFDALREPVVPTDPDPDFAASLRARIERALALPRGVAVTSTITEQPPTIARGAAVPYLAVAIGSGRRALDWYVEVLGAHLVGEPITMDDGRVGHAELALSGGTLYLAEEFPEIGVIAPSPAGTPVSLSLQVPDVAETMRLAIGRGGRMPRPMYDDYGSRNVTIVDPFGHRWLLHTPLSELPETQRPGDVGYAWLTVPDPDRAAAFYGAVLGWRFSPGYAPGGRTVEGQALPMGLGAGEPGFHLSYAVEDVAAAVERVRAAGGTATDPQERPYGTAADCADDHGVAFALHPAGTAPRSPENGRGQGDLSYLTLEVADSARFRRFYGQVLGWTFTGGTVDDGWNVPGVSPMTGMHGGHAADTAVPMWKVPDVAAAVERVRAAGGTATDPARQPYGTTSECTDDQGVRFYLGDA
ncbi:MAG TPA: VOC family protein [Mycobacteriales bacterium]|jgi:predicted enzyme related to lactoylglutathione lyase